MDVDISHPPSVGFAQEWFAACLIQKVVRGKVHRNQVARRLVRTRQPRSVYIFFLRVVERSYKKDVACLQRMPGRVARGCCLRRVAWCLLFCCLFGFESLAPYHMCKHAIDYWWCITSGKRPGVPTSHPNSCCAPAANARCACVCAPVAPLPYDGTVMRGAEESERPQECVDVIHVW